MTYFSRLSDIISCKLEDLLADAPDPAAAVARIISEIEEGLAGAKRSVNSAANAEDRLRAELAERAAQVGYWAQQAREELLAGREDGARQALSRKKEAEDLQAGLEQQLAAATSTREHLTTTLRAIDARLAEARRRQQDLANGLKTAPHGARVPHAGEPAPLDRSRAAQVEAELEALRKELRQALP
ncbi:MAG: PspA/IM30 family protein [Planctomycetaceae bacterium]